MISPAWHTWMHPKTSQPYTLSVHTPSTLSSRDFNACFSLIELTSGDDYRASRDGWKPKAKKKEMKLLDLRYLIIKTMAEEDKDKEEEEGEVKGFVSVMPTYEDDYETLYVYEIHLHPDLQGYVCLCFSRPCVCLILISFSLDLSFYFWGEKSALFPKE